MAADGQGPHCGYTWLLAWGMANANVCSRAPAGRRETTVEILDGSLGGMMQG